MRSNTINIDNQGNGFDNAIEETRKVAVYEGLSHKESLQLELCMEEMLSLARSITGEIKASLWVETEGRKFDLHMSTSTVMDTEKRELLLAAATSGKNEAANSFLGYLRDAFAKMLTAEPDHHDELPEDVLGDLANHTIECTDPEWDGYEQSTLRRLADNIKIGIRGSDVEIVVSTHFA